MNSSSPSSLSRVFHDLKSVLMDLDLVTKGLDYSRRRKKWLLLLAAFGISSYGVYRVYNLPSVVQKRRKFIKLVGTLISLIEVVSDSTETIGVVSKDLKEFLQSDSDEIPTSLKQISKIARSEEFSQSVVRVTEALTIGILRGYKTESKNDSKSSPDLSDKVFEKLFSTAGTGFVSVVVGSFAKNLVLGFYEEQESDKKVAQVESDTPRWVNVICNDKCKGMIADSIQMFVSTAVAVYLDKTMDINTYDEIFAGLTNPKHETKIRDIMGSLCNGAVETLIKTSHHVMTSPPSNSLNSNASSSSSSLDIDQGDVTTEASELRKRNSGDDAKDGGWGDKVFSTLAVPRNKRFVLDMTGKVTYETVRSLLEFVVQRLMDGLKRSFTVVHEEVVERGLDVFRYVSARSAALVTMCFAFCLHLVGGYRGVDAGVNHFHNSNNDDKLTFGIFSLNAASGDNYNLSGGRFMTPICCILDISSDEEEGRTLSKIKLEFTHDFQSSAANYKFY